MGIPLVLVVEIPLVSGAGIHLASVTPIPLAEGGLLLGPAEWPPALAGLTVRSVAAMPLD